MLPAPGHERAGQHCPSLSNFRAKHEARDIKRIRRILAEIRWDLATAGISARSRRFFLLKGSVGPNLARLEQTLEEIVVAITTETPHDSDNEAALRLDR